MPGLQEVAAAARALHCNVQIAVARRQAGRPHPASPNLDVSPPLCRRTTRRDGADLSQPWIAM